MNKKLILIGTISLLIIIIVFIICQSEEGEDYYYNSYALKKFDLKGPVKSISIDQFFLFPTNNFPDNLFYEPGNRNVSFSLSGLINHQETQNCIYTYNSNGQLIKKSFRNDQNIEYGYSTFEYLNNFYYTGEHGDYKIDNSKEYIDTIILVESGTRDKYRQAYLESQMKAIEQGKKEETRIDFSDIGISRFYVMNKKGDVLEQFGRDIQYGYFKYKYDTIGRITYKYEGYQGITLYKDSISYTISYDTTKITHYRFGRGISDTIYKTFIQKNYDNYGNWQDLYYLDKLVLTREIRYY